MAQCALLDSELGADVDVDEVDLQVRADQIVQGQQLEIAVLLVRVEFLPRHFQQIQRQSFHFRQYILFERLRFIFMIGVELLRRDLYLRDGLRFDRRVLSGTELTVMY